MVEFEEEAKHIPQELVAAKPMPYSQGSKEILPKELVLQDKVRTIQDVYVRLVEMLKHGTILHELLTIAIIRDTIIFYC